jgi:hypothetical protein
MNSPTRELLFDLLTERDASFDERLTTGTLAAVRRRLHQRQAGRVTLAVAVIALLICWMQLSRNPTPTIATAPSPSAPEYLFRTQPLTAEERVATLPATLAVVVSQMDESLIVKTVPSPDLYQPITDEELTRLLAGHNPVIIRQPGNPAILLLDGQPVGAPFDLN